MGRVHVVTDSNCHLPAALCKELGIQVVQLPYEWDGLTYLDEIDMAPREFYSRLRESETLPTTAGPPPGFFVAAYQEVAQDAGPIVVIHVGSEFSTTFRTAELAKEMVPEVDIRLVDSHSNALGMGFQVLAAARAARRGADIEEVVAIAERAGRNSGLVFTVKDLNFLRRGGRIRFGQKMLASMLGIVPVMQIENGPVRLVGRARTSKKVMPKLVQAVKERANDKRPIRVGVLHADNEAEAFELRRAVEVQIAPDELLLEELRPSVGTHAGPGALGLAYCIGV